MLGRLREFLRAAATRDFEVGIDKIVFQFTTFESLLRADPGSYLSDTAQGVTLAISGLNILVAGVSEAELLAAPFDSVFEFI